MMQANRRSALKLLGGAALTAGAVPSLVLPAAAQTDLYVPSKYQNFKRGTIDSLNPESKTFTIIWQDLGRVKLKVSDLNVASTSAGLQGGNSYAQLKPGQIVDVQWYDYVDFLIAPMSAETMGQAAAMKAKGAKIEGVPGSAPAIRLWEMDGMVTKVDPANSQIFVIYKSGGEPDRPAPNAGEVIQLPRIVSDAGKAAMATLKPGDDVVTVWSQQTALNVKIIR
jgi:hypothetical protein